jgi:hypothetical protein
MFCPTSTATLVQRENSYRVRKLTMYKRVYMTEHYPSDNDSIKPNIDKIHGADIRLYSNSGVYFSEPLFELPGKRLSKVLEVLGVGLERGTDQGVIRTFLYTPGAWLRVIGADIRYRGLVATRFYIRCLTNLRQSSTRALIDCNGVHRLA